MKNHKIKVARFTTTSELVYQNVEIIFSHNAQKNVGIKKYITADYVDQIAVLSNDEVILMPDWNLALLEVRKMKPKQEFKKIKRLTTSGIQFSPAFIIDDDKWHKCNIPVISDNQLVFIADNNLYITRQAGITEIVI